MGKYIRQCPGLQHLAYLWRCLELDTQRTPPTYSPTCGIAWNLIRSASPADFQVAWVREESR